MISAVLCVYNEEKNIEECLKSLSFVDEIIIVDDGSSDKTVEIAKKYTDKIFPHDHVGYVEPLRNLAIAKAAGNWILVLDADERVPTSLAEKLQTIVSEDDPKLSCIEIPRKNMIFGKWIEHTGWWPDYQRRFFRKDKVTWSDEIHSVPEVDGEVIKLPSEEAMSILHENYENIADYLQRMDRYTSIESEEAREVLHISHFLQKPASEFLFRFFAKEGYKDKEHGLVLSLLQSYFQLVTLTKQWEKNNYKMEGMGANVESVTIVLSSLAKEYLYWYYTVKIESSSNPISKLIYKVKRKLHSL